MAVDASAIERLALGLLRSAPLSLDDLALRLEAWKISEGLGAAAGVRASEVPPVQVEPEPAAAMGRPSATTPLGARKVYAVTRVRHVDQSLVGVWVTTWASLSQTLGLGNGGLAGSGCHLKRFSTVTEAVAYCISNGLEEPIVHSPSSSSSA